MIEAGQSAPGVGVYSAPGEGTTLAQLWADGAILLVFYLFDWSST